MACLDFDLAWGDGSQKTSEDPRAPWLLDYIGPNRDLLHLKKGALPVGRKEGWKSRETGRGISGVEEYEVLVAWQWAVTEPSQE